MKVRTADVIAHYGTAAEPADALGVHRSAVTQWGAFVPTLRAFQLHVITEGVLGESAPEPE